MSYRFTIVALPLLIACVALGDAIVTTDGRRLEGELRKSPTGWQVTGADGKATEVPSSQIRTIELTSDGANTGMERLYSLRRSVDVSDDIPKIIERYRKFIDQTTDRSVLGAAMADLKLWQDRLERGLVKVGKRWMTPEERQQFAIDTIDRVNRARLLIKSQRGDEAARLIDEVLDDDPRNVSALYLRGVVMLQRDALNDARKSFQAAADAIPGHAPTLHNLAVILMRQRQWGPAAGMAERALAAAPDVQFLIDQSAELLELLPEDQRKIKAAQRLAERFAAQDAKLQKLMLEKGLYRWGATWVDKATYDKLQAAEAEVRKRLDELQGDFDLTQNRIARIDTEISANERAMRDIERGSWVRTADGTLVRVPLPPAYYDMQREVARLKGERQEMVQRLDALREAAKRAQADLPVPKFTGQLLPIAEDGVPIVVPEGVRLEPLAPATQPAATQPPATQPAASPPKPADKPADKPEIIIKIGPARDAR